MGIEKLTSSLLVDARNEAGEIIKAAEWHVEKMLSEEKAKRAILLKNAEEEAQHLIAEYEKERVAWSRLEAKRIISEAKEDAVRDFLDAFFDMLPALKKSAAYKDFVKSCLKKAGEELGSNVLIHCVKGEKSLISSVSSGKVVEDLKSIGGVVVETSDGKSRIDMRFESLFDSKREDLRKYFYQLIFGSEGKQKIKEVKRK